MCAALPITMPTAHLHWFCTQCGTKLRKQRRVHEACGGLVEYRCLPSHRRGMYTRYRRHALHCPHCSPDASDALHERKQADQENRMHTVEDEEMGHSAQPPTSVCGPLSASPHVLTPDLSPLCAWCRVSYTSMGALDGQRPLLGGDDGAVLAQMEWTYTRCRPALTAYRLSLRHTDDNQPVMSPHNMLCIAIHWLRRGQRSRESEVTFNRPHQWLHTMVKKVVAIIGEAIFDELIRPIDLLEYCSVSPMASRETHTVERTDSGERQDARLRGMSERRNQASHSVRTSSRASTAAQRIRSSAGSLSSLSMSLSRSLTTHPAPCSGAASPLWGYTRP